jgi:hypothetical protein
MFKKLIVVLSVTEALYLRGRRRQEPSKWLAFDETKLKDLASLTDNEAVKLFAWEPRDKILEADVLKQITTDARRNLLSAPLGLALHSTEATSEFGRALTDTLKSLIPRLDCDALSEVFQRFNATTRSDKTKSKFMANMHGTAIKCFNFILTQMVSKSSNSRDSPVKSFGDSVEKTEDCEILNRLTDYLIIAKETKIYEDFLMPKLLGCLEKKEFLRTLAMLALSKWSTTSEARWTKLVNIPGVKMRYRVQLAQGLLLAGPPDNLQKAFMEFSDSLSYAAEFEISGLLELNDGCPTDPEVMKYITVDSISIENLPDLVTNNIHRESCRSVLTTAHRRYLDRATIPLKKLSEYLSRLRSHQAPQILIDETIQARDRIIRDLGSLTKVDKWILGYYFEDLRSSLVDMIAVRETLKGESFLAKLTDQDMLAVAIKKLCTNKTVIQKQFYRELTPRGIIG